MKPIKNHIIDLIRIRTWFWESTRHKIGDNIWYQLLDQMEYLIRHQIRDKVRNPIRGQIRE